MDKTEQVAETVRTDVNGRRPDGTFGPNNRAAAGRRSRSAALRKAFEAAISEDDIAALAESMLKAAKLGDISAAKLLCDQILVKPNIEAIVAERIGAWKFELLHEILYALDTGYRLHILRGSSSSVMGDMERTIRSLPTFQD